MLPFRYRTVVYSPRFEKELEAMREGFLRVDEFVEGAEWVLCRKPDIGTNVGMNLWFLPTARGVTPAIIYYAFDENHVWFLSIQRTQYHDEE